MNSQTARRLAAAGVDTALAEGFKAARDLDVPVTIATRSDPTRFAAWRSARSIGGRSSQRAPAPETPKDPAAPMPPPVPEPAGAEPASPPEHAPEDVLRRAS